MTSPIDNLDFSGILPYSIPLGNAASADMEVLAGAQKGKTTVTLAAGTYLVNLSYDGPERATFAYKDNRTGRWVAPAAVVDAGSGPRTSLMVQLVFSQGGNITVQARPQPAAGSPGTAALNIYPLQIG